jgi:hypothetical protein
VKAQRSVRRVWVLEVKEDDLRGRPTKTYLHAIGGDWGLSHMPRKELEGCLEFDSYADAARWARENHRGLGWSMTPVEVEVKVSYKLVAHGG